MTTREDARRLREAEAALERARGAQRGMLREIARDLDRNPGARGDRQMRAFQEIQAAEDALEGARRAVSAGIVQRYASGEVTREEAEREREALIGQGSGLATQTSLGLWAADSQRARQAPLTDPRNFEGIEELLEGQQKEGGDASGSPDTDLREDLAELELIRPKVLDAQERLPVLSSQVARLQSSLTGVTSPAERQKIEGRLATLNEDLAEAQQVIGDYAAKAEPFVKLQSAMQLATLVENTSAEQAHDALFNIASAIKEGAINGGIAGGLTGAPGGPAAAAAGAGGGAVVGGVSSGLSTLAAGALLSVEELEVLPALLKDNPEDAIKLIGKTGLLQTLAVVAGALASGITIAPKLGYSTADAALGALIGSVRNERAD
ncbi:hypothetical protein [Limibacillus halophilus]